MNEIRALIQQIRQGIADDSFSPEEMGRVNSVIDNAHSFLRQRSQSQAPQGSEALWLLSGENPRAFTAYMRSFPNPAFNQFSRNKEGMDNLINRFSSQITTPGGESENGVPKADLQSSNIYGFQYDPSSQMLRVRFNGGGVYEYDNVPPMVYKMFQRGAIPAKTEGRNQYGAWWVGKQPSLGASFHQLIRDNFPYERVA